MSAISETYNRGHNILKLVGILPKFLWTSQVGIEVKRNRY